MEFGDPEEVGREVFDFAFFVVFGEFLLVVVEAGSETTFGVFVHGAGADLEFDDAFVLRDDGGVEGLVAVLFRHGDVVFDTTFERGVEGVDETEDKVAVSDVFDDDAEGGEVIDSVDVLVIFRKFTVERID